MYGSWVRPKVAGVESRAKMTLASPIAEITIPFGVNSRRPSTRVVKLATTVTAANLMTVSQTITDLVDDDVMTDAWS